MAMNDVDSFPNGAQCVLAYHNGAPPKTKVITAAGDRVV